MTYAIMPTESYQTLCDKLREKTGGTDELVASDIPGIIKQFTSDKILKSYIAGTLTSYSNDRITKVGDYAFYNCSKLVDVYFPNVVEVGGYAFQGSKITEVTSENFPNLTTLNQHSFRSCGSLTYVNLPKVEVITGYAFNTSSYIKEAQFDNATSTGNRAFVTNSRLEKVILPKMQSIYGLTFYQCYSLKAVILGSDTLCSLLNVDAFNQCYHILGTVNSTWNKNGDKDGYIYVPRALIEDYKVATNWATYAEQFRAIEDYPEICGDV